MLNAVSDSASRALISEGAGELKKSGTPRLDAEILLSFACGVERTEILLNPSKKIARETEKKYRELIERRKNREPIAYIVGRKDFYKSSFKVNDSVLIPRPETEGLVEEALKRFGNEKLKVLDVGTGSGCIAISLGLERPRWEITAVDISDKALSVAKENASLLGAGNVTFAASDLFKNVAGEFDLIVSNPPYVSRFDEKSLEPDVVEFEPSGALFADDDGLEAIKKILAGSPRFLKPEGSLFCEIGFGQKEKIEAVTNGEDWEKFDFVKDLAGIDRIFIAEARSNG